MPALDLNLLRRVYMEKLAERRERIFAWCLALLSLIVLWGVFYALYLKAPQEFLARTIVTIPEKAGLNEITELLVKERIIRSPFLFRVTVVLMDGQRGVQAGDYFFERPVTVFRVASRLTRGAHALTPVRFTFREGVTVRQVALALEDELIDFDTAEFLKLAKPEEGYLFPDTYFFPPNTKPAAVIAELKKNFENKMKTIDESVRASKKSLKDIVIMASLLEAEARTTETRRTIAGILWKRLSLGMPLQVDAPFQYIIGKNTFQLTTADLQYDSPYNTYRYKGLPPTAIGNPGLDSLHAAVTPIASPYFFYLSDIRGNMHYVVTHDEHVLNKEKYLK